MKVVQKAVRPPVVANPTTASTTSVWNAVSAGDEHRHAWCRIPCTYHWPNSFAETDMPANNKRYCNHAQGRDENSIHKQHVKRNSFVCNDWERYRVITLEEGPLERRRIQSTCESKQCQYNGMPMQYSSTYQQGRQISTSLQRPRNL